jgi:hypothetical protein
MKTGILSLLTALLLGTATTGWAQDAGGTCGDNLTWTLSKRTLTVRGTGRMTDFASFGFTPWYRHIASIATVIIENGVTAIGSCAFEECDNLQSVTVSSTVTGIGSYAFHSCNSLTSLTIPDSVASIGREAFGGCSSLADIIVAKGNNCYSSRRGVLFNKEGTALICYPEGKTGNYTVPGHVTAIGDGAFIYCIGLTAVVIPSCVTDIGNEAFAYCRNLASVTNLNPVLQDLPDNVFDGVNLSNATLFVPAGTKIAGVWKNFGTINEWSADSPTGNIDDYRAW